jgi:methionyl aminopeptidase
MSALGPVPIHTAEDFVGMRKAGALAAAVLEHIESFIHPGVTTNDLDKICHDFICDHGAIPAPLGYHGFPKSICTSIDHVVCHGIPQDKPLVEGQILNIDVSVILEGWHGDTARMFVLGKIPTRVQELIDVTLQALYKGIGVVRPGAYLGDVGHAIQSFVQSHGFSVVRDFCGHGIGRQFHAPPEVLHYGRSGTGLQLQVGHFFTIEPMINMGRADVKILPDGWTVVTRDRKPSAQFEHTLGVTPTGCEIFTHSAAWGQKHAQSRSRPESSLSAGSMAQNLDGAEPQLQGFLSPDHKTNGFSGGGNSDAMI